MLHEVDELGVYCAPAALIAVTGKRLPEVRSAINKVRGFRDTQGVIGLKTEYLEKAMQTLGIEFRRVDYPFRITLKEFNIRMVIGMPYIIAFNTHYVACQDRKLIDNHYRFGTDMLDCKWSKKHIETVWEIVEVSNVN